jgi:hypothetical protein
MPNEDKGTPAGGEEEIRRARHAILSTALPFPELDWTNKTDDKENLIKLRDYSESLANSAMDWYLGGHKKKKRLAQGLHFWIYFCIGLAGLFPLLKLTFVDILGSCSSSREFWCIISTHAAEGSLLFIGFAGGLKLWDNNWGYTVDWMRFMTTAAQISRELTKFQFDWEKVDPKNRQRTERNANKAQQKSSLNSNGDAKVGSAPKKTKYEICPSCGCCVPIDHLDPTQNKIKLAGDFCAQILDIVDKEISIWADELKKRIDQIPAHHPLQSK